GIGRRVAVGVLACTAVGLFFSTQIYLIYRQLGSTVGWGAALHSALVCWYSWGLLAVPVFALARRFPVDGSRWRVRVPLHLLGAAAIALVHTTLCVGWYRLVEAGSPGARAWWPAFQNGFVLYFHWDVLIYAAILGFVHALDYYRRLRD